MSKIEELSRALAAELKDKQAHVTAAEAQLKALQQTHGELHGQLSGKQQELADVNKSIADARAEAKRIEADAQRRAGEIVDEANRMNREAQAAVAAAHDEATRIVDDARKQVRGFDDAISKKRVELQGAIQAQEKAQAGLAAVKKAARDFADS